MARKTKSSNEGNVPLTLSVRPASLIEEGTRPIPARKFGVRYKTTRLQFWEQRCRAVRRSGSSALGVG